jgi:hypothetical protein
MRNFFILGAAIAVTACGDTSTIGFGHEHLDGGSETGGSSGKTGAGGNSSTGGHANGGKPSTGGNSSTDTGGQPSSGGYPNSGGAIGHAGAGGCSGVFHCPASLACPAGQEHTTLPGECCATGPCAPVGTGGSTGAGCKSAGECAVPAICKLCPDGSSSCAAGACVNGQCTTTFPPCPTAGDAGTGLKWFATCGPPLCRDPATPTGAPICDPNAGQAVGDACPMEGATCDPGVACSGNLLCATKDPKSSVGCPVSRAKYKQDIRYLSGDERSKLAEDLQSIPLVRYRYKDGPEREHLGFIIEDIEPSPSVDSQHDQVDLYGYTSMAVAALQQQHAEIQTLKEEVRALKAALARSKNAK